MRVTLDRIRLASERLVLRQTLHRERSGMLGFWLTEKMSLSGEGHGWAASDIVGLLKVVVMMVMLWEAFRRLGHRTAVELMAER